MGRAYNVIYSFKGLRAKDGAYPFAGLLHFDDTLYGTTSYGGERRRTRNGTVFSLTPSGAETVLHSFGHNLGGERPYGGLISVKGMLYGTTSAGGARENCPRDPWDPFPGCGTVFAITPSGTETRLYSFKGGTYDGAHPLGNLLNVKGTLYGTTFEGGANDEGTVFSLTPSGVETVLYSFGSDSQDGAGPEGDLINVNGTLYGTTSSGGAYCGGTGSCGTVFSITTAGKETVLHSFGGGSGDGGNPNAGLANVNGTLYGTTFFGGINCGSTGCGTVFKIMASGKETVLHRFGGSSGDGAQPEAGLLNVNGALFGTTFYGGANCGSVGCGTAFKVTTSGKETVLHSFGGSGDGARPIAGLIDVRGALYGTTSGGGASNYGTVFSLSP